MKEFTLIEILVIVGIIGMLLTILMPSIKSAREKAKSSVCMSNLGQQKVAMTVYAHEEEYFPTLVEPRPNGNQHHWAKPSRVKIENIPFECPSDEDYFKGGSKWEISYGFNNKNLAGVDPANVKDPVETILIADSAHQGDEHPWMTRAPAGYVINKAAGHPGPIGGRHLGTANILWVDGHVSILRDIITIHTSADKWDIE